MFQTLINLFSVAKTLLKVALASGNRSLIAHTSKCGRAISPSFGSPLLNWEVYSIIFSKLIGDFPAVLNELTSTGNFSNSTSSA